MRTRMLAAILLTLVLAACNTPTASPQSPTETIPPTITEPPTTAPLTSTDPPTATAKPTMSATPEPSNTPPPETATGTPVDAVQPSPESVPDAPGIHSIAASPDAIKAGETVTLTWQATGDRAWICPTLNTFMDVFSDQDCVDVPLSGSLDYVIPPEVTDSFPMIRFTLTVEAGSPPETYYNQVDIPIKCDLTWFFSDESLVSYCPVEPITAHSAIQAFEHGTMIWVEPRGEYLIMTDRVWESGKQQLFIVHDPLDVIADTSGENQPPDGLFAPQGGFGLIWRGDVSNTQYLEENFRDVLGWALGPESYYEAVYQCNRIPGGWATTHARCHMLDPEGRLITFHPNGGWYQVGP